MATAPFARSAVDRAAHRRSDVGWLDSAWKDDASRVLVVGDAKVAASDGALAWAAPSEAPDGERFLLGVADGVTFLASHVPAAPLNGLSLRAIGTELDDLEGELAVHALALANWHETHGFCPRCGAPTFVEEGGHVRRCPEDNSQHFPRTDPAVITLVVDENDRCLLGSSTAWPGNRYSTLAGFVEPGETPEVAVAREVAEESGIEVADCWYAGAQPWPFPTNLMLGYYATARGAEPVPGGDEMRDVRWFMRGEVAELAERGQIRLSPAISISSRLIEGWLHAT